MDFNKAFNFIIEQEGGYSNDPKDPGGETKYGISKRHYPNLDIANLTLVQAQVIYKQDYWDKCKCDLLLDHLKLSVVDMAVNQGPAAAIKTLQKIAKVTQDGNIGNLTLKAANGIDKIQAVSNFLAERIMLYYTSNPINFSIYGKGWISRAVKATMQS